MLCHAKHGPLGHCFDNTAIESFFGTLKAESSQLAGLEAGLH